MCVYVIIAGQTHRKHVDDKRLTTAWQKSKC